MTSGPVSGQVLALDDAELEALLSAAVLRGYRPDAEGEQRAVAAFRAAREAGAHRARTRRRDDWRPREQRRLALSGRTTLSVFLASLTLGGVAFATIGSSDSSAEDKGGATPSAGAPDRPATERPTPAGSARPDHPATSRDTEAKCRAYDQLKDSGRAMDSTAWQRLVGMAGGEDKVAAYCAGRPVPQSDPTGRAAKSGATGEAERGGAADNGPSRGEKEKSGGNAGKKD
ncbi:hypothetical protein [Streptomyces sp. NPDC098781]|uniref:hypothetical protein n=1 Tax=Streptomyces sp. NPDC098781 TaxID=3366097 RepID=UPI00381B1C5B